jgi:hypothetical protein
MPSRKLTRSIIVAAAAIVIGGGSYGIVSATTSGGSSRGVGKTSVTRGHLKAGAQSSRGSADEAGSTGLDRPSAGLLGRSPISDADGKSARRRLHGDKNLTSSAQPGHQAQAEGVPQAPILAVTITTQPPIPPSSAQMAPGDRVLTNAPSTTSNSSTASSSFGAGTGRVPPRRPP